MYRYQVDNAVTYTPEDISLFRESPFALWMERLTLENPGHGIPPDPNTRPPSDEIQPQDALVDALREEGRDVALVDWALDEPRRRADTLDAMRNGADFIVNGTLALGPLSGRVNMLMRTSGHSDLGDYIYIPCDTQPRSVFGAAFRLSFLADLLHSLQGQLPPQMLIVRGDADVQPLGTEDHIYYYRAVKLRFMEAMGRFRKHRMPDPSESAHFGRWSQCASEVLRQRALDGERYDEEVEEEVQAEVMVAGTAAAQAAIEQVERPALRVAAGAERVTALNARVHMLQASALRAGSAGTLAEQAKMFDPGAYRNLRGPGHTPNLARFGKPATVTTVEVITDSDYRPRRDGDDRGSGVSPAGGGETAPFTDAPATVSGDASTRAEPDTGRDDAAAPPAAAGALERHAYADEAAEPPDVEFIADAEPEGKAEVFESITATGNAHRDRAVGHAAQGESASRLLEDSLVDLDSAPPPTLAPVRLPGLKRDEEEVPEEAESPAWRERPVAPVKRPPTSPFFSDSLITGDDFEDEPE